METGIIGLPLSGKTTIFNALTGLSASITSYTGGKKQINLSEIEVPDARVDKLTELFKPKKKTYATILVKDIPVAFDNQQGILPASLGEIRNSDAIAIVVRAFIDKSVPHPFETIDPVRDLDKILESLIFSDYEVVDKRLERLKKEGKKKEREFVILEKIFKKLDAGELIGENFLNGDELKQVSGFRFLTLKPMVVIANTGDENADIEKLKQRAESSNLTFFDIKGKIEMEIAQLPKEEQQDFLEEMGIEEPTVKRFVRKIYQSLNLISFLTVGEDEVRAWSVPKGSTAPKAAGKIHSDLEKGFIRAEVIRWDDLLKYGSFSEAKRDGKVAVHGKDYIVKDGDVILVRFNV